MHRIYKSTNKFIIIAKLFNQESDSRFVIRINTIKKSVSQQRSKVSLILIRSNARMFECSRNIFLEVSYWFLNTISSEYSSFFSLIEHQYLFVCDLRGYTSGILQVCSRPWSWRGAPWPGETTRYLSPWKRANFVSRARTNSVNWSRHNLCETFIELGLILTHVFIIFLRMN